jgi:hypothetical protein
MSSTGGGGSGSMRAHNVLPQAQGVVAGNVVFCLCVCDDVMTCAESRKAIQPTCEEYGPEQEDVVAGQQQPVEQRRAGEPGKVAVEEED